MRHPAIFGLALALAALPLAAGDAWKKKPPTRRTTYQDAPGERPVSVPTEVSTTTPQVAEAVYEVQWSSAGAPAQAWERLRQGGGAGAARSAPRAPPPPPAPG